MIVDRGKPTSDIMGSYTMHFSREIFRRKVLLHIHTSLDSRPIGSRPVRV